MKFKLYFIFITCLLFLINKNVIGQDTTIYVCEKFYKFTRFPNEFFAVHSSSQPTIIKENMCSDDFEVPDGVALFLRDTIYFEPLKKSSHYSDFHNRIAIMILMARGYREASIEIDLKLSDFFEIPSSIAKGKHFNGQYMFQEILFFFDDFTISCDCYLNDIYLKVSKTKFIGLDKYTVYCKNKKIFNFHAAKLYNTPTLTDLIID